MPWWGFAILASSSAITTEYVYRTYGTLQSAGLRAVLPVILLQIGLFYNYNRAPNVFAAWIVFTIGTATLRLVMAATLLDDPFNARWTVAGTALMVAAAYCIKQATP